jgi:cation diffusion facilitator family transporter
MRAEKRAVAGSSVVAALAITALKIVVGVTTGSLGILSEALHSVLDLIAAIITLMSVRVSDKPADADHQYGHDKVENFSAFIETGLLLLTCFWIIYEAGKRLFFHHVDIEPTIAAFVVMFISMAVDFWRSRALGRIAAGGCALRSWRGRLRKLAPVPQNYRCSAGCRSGWSAEQDRRSRFWRGRYAGSGPRPHSPRRQSLLR